MDEIRAAGSLRDIQKLGVVIERLPSEPVQRELYQRRLRTQVEDRLSQAGIEVLPEREAINNGFPYLYVNVNLIKTAVGLYVFATRVCLKQTMLLPREPFVKLYTSTWEIGGVGTVGVNNLSAMLGSVRQQLDRFCQDHLAENLDFDSDGYRPSLKLETAGVSWYRVPGWIKQLGDSFSSFHRQLKTRRGTRGLSAAMGVGQNNQSH
jgi:hypothetical protein